MKKELRFRRYTFSSYQSYQGYFRGKSNHHFTTLLSLFSFSFCFVYVGITFSSFKMKKEYNRSPSEQRKKTNGEMKWCSLYHLILNRYSIDRIDNSMLVYYTLLSTRISNYDFNLLFIGLESKP